MGVSQFRTDYLLTGIFKLPHWARQLGPAGVEIRQCIFAIQAPEMAKVKVTGNALVKLEYEAVGGQRLTTTEPFLLSVVCATPGVVATNATAEGNITLDSIMNIPEIDPDQFWITQVITHLFFSITVRILEP